MTTFATSYKSLRQWSDMLGPLASTDDCRPTLTCLHVVFNGITVTVEATDSYKLGRFVFTNHDVVGQPFDILVDAKWLAATLKAMRFRAHAIDVTTDERMCAISSPMETFTFRDTRTSAFPNVDRIIADADAAEYDLTQPTGALALQHLQHVMHLSKQANITIRMSDKMKVHLFDVRHDNVTGIVAVMPVRRPT